jgi:hypothetical protein
MKCGLMWVRRKMIYGWIWTAVFDKDFKFFELGKRDEGTDVGNFTIKYLWLMRYKQMDIKFMRIWIEGK